MATRLRFALLAALVLGIGACGDSSSPSADTSVDGGQKDTTVDSTADTPPSGDITIDGPARDSTVDSTQPDMPGDSTPDIAPDTSPDVGPDLPAPDTTVDTTASDAFVQPTNTTCATARVLTLSNGYAHAIGSLTGGSSEYTLSCRRHGATSNSTISGYNVYYKFTPVQNSWYRINLTPTFTTAYAIVFTNPSCAEADIETDCQSEGGTGNTSDSVSSSNTTRSVYYRAGAPTDVYIIVKGSSTSSAGDFRLEIQEITPPTNGTCSGAQTITLTNNVGTATGDSSPSLTPDEFSTLGCNSFGSTSGSTTAMDGPQTYYKFAGTQGELYRISVSTTGHSAYAYVFRNNTCTQATIEADCQSTGSVDGGRTSSSFTQSGTSFFYRAPATGDIYVAVDSSDGADWGQHTVRVEHIVNGPAATCATAQALTLTNGSVTVNGFTDTGATADEFPSLACQSVGSTSNTTMDGPNAYYKFAATQNQWYRLTLSPSFSAYMYAFTSSSCTAAAINTDCTSAGATGLTLGSVSSGRTESIYFKAPATGDVYLGIDSTSATTDGNFTLTIREVSAPTNGTCAGAQSLTFSNGVATATGYMDPYATPNEFSDGTACGSTTLDGPNAYFQFNAQANAAYTVTVESVELTGSVYAYIFGASCTEANIETDCSSSGSTGQLSPSISSTVGESETLYVAPGAAGVRHIGLGSTANSLYGEFKITVREFTTAPTNQTCATAQAITLTNNAAKVNGSTILAANEYASSISCGTSNTFGGGQVYYSLAVNAGTEYTFKLAPTFAAQLYLFTGACDATNINTSCSTSGQHAAVSANGTGTITYTPSATGTLYIAVDGVNPSDAGNFQLDVSAFVVPTLTAPFSLDFETSSGGLAAKGDWEWGQLNFVTTSNCSAIAVPPTNNQGPTGGKGMWGTVLNGCYSPLGNNQGSASGATCTSSNTADDSQLVFNVSIPSTWTTATLTWVEWFDVFTYFDFGEIFINGTAVLTKCNASTNGGGEDSSWQTRNIDLSSYVGQTIKIAFHMMASSGTDLAGWYIDSLSVSGN